MINIIQKYLAIWRKGLVFAVILAVALGLTAAALLMSPPGQTAQAAPVNFSLSGEEFTPARSPYDWLNAAIDGNTAHSLELDFWVLPNNSIVDVFFELRGTQRRVELLRVEGHVTNWSVILAHFNAGTVSIRDSEFTDPSDTTGLTSFNNSRISGMWTYFIFVYPTNASGSYPSVLPFAVIPTLIHVTAQWNLPTPSAPSGFIFGGWYFDTAFTQPYNGFGVTADTVLHARFIPIIYTITYNLNGGSLSGKPTTFTIQSADITLPVPTRTGHYFRGWHTNPSLSGQAVTEIPAGSINNRAFYARWEIQRLTVTFMVNGVPYQSMVVDWGTVLSSMTFVDPMTGQIAQLYGDVDLSAVFNFGNYGVTGDTVIFADGPVNIFVALTFNVMGETTTHLLPYNERLGLLMAVERPGLIFEGWYHDSAFVRPVQPNDRLTSNRTIYARFVPIQFEYPEPSGALGRVMFFIIGGGIMLSIFAVFLIIGLIVKKARGN